MAMKIRVLLSSVVVLTMMWLASCGGHYKCGITFGNSSCSSSGSGTGLGGGSTGSGAPTAFAFSAVVGTTPDLIESFTFSVASKNILPTANSTGQSAPASGGGRLIVAQGKYLYGEFSATGFYNQIFGWSIDASGNLTPISGSPFILPNWAGAILGNMTTNPAGTLLFRADPGSVQGQALVYVLQIGAGGVLTEASGSPFAVPFAPGSMGTDGLGNYLYVTGLASSLSPAEIGAYAIGSGGSLTPVVGSPFVYPMTQVVGDGSGKFLIGITDSSTGDDHLYVFGIQQSGTTAGAISPVFGSPFATLYSPFGIAIQPAGEFLYSFSNNPVEGYQVNTSTGAVTPVTGSPFSTITIQEGEFDQSGTYLFGKGGNTLTAYQVSSTGSLNSMGDLVEGWGTIIAIADVP